MYNDVKKIENILPPGVPAQVPALQVIAFKSTIQRSCTAKERHKKMQGPRASIAEVCAHLPQLSRLLRGGVSARFTDHDEPITATKHMRLPDG